MQIQGKIDPRGDPHYKNSISCFTTIWSNYKINGLYKGFSVTMVRELIGITMYFTAYHYSGRKIFGDSNKNTDELEKHKIFVCGAIAGYAYWMVYPLDVIKSKIQSDSLSNPKFKSIQDCIRSTYNAGG